MHGEPKIDWQAQVPRKPKRFMEAGVGWNYIAMEQAIRDAGLETKDVVDERTGIIMGEGGPSTRAIVWAADTTRQKDPRRSARSRCRRRCARALRALATTFQIKGTNYSISSACATSAHCIGNAAELIQWGKQDLMFAGGCEELDWTLSVLFDAMGAMSSKFNDTPERPPRLRQVPRRLRHRRRCGVLVLEEREAKARGARIYEVAGYGASSDGFDMVALRRGRGAVHAARDEGPRRQGHAAGRLHQPARDGHARRRRARGAGDPRRLRRPHPADLGDQVADRPFAGRGGRAGGDLLLLMMNNGFVCESANIEELDPAFDGAPIARERMDGVTLDCVMSNSFGFGGTNATLVFRRHDG